MTHQRSLRLGQLRIAAAMTNVRIASKREGHHDREPQSRDCVRMVHKLRNIGKAIQLPDDLDPEERRRKRKAILRDFKGIWQAKQYATILRRYLQVYRQYRSLQPAAVATLRRDFRATLAYYPLAQEHPAWQRRFLRTTSQLERFNRCLRKRCRTAGAYHSDEGLLAMIAQTADEAFRPGTLASARRHTIPTE